MSGNIPSLSLAYLTCEMLSPPEAIRLAGELGYQSVGLRALPVAPGAPFSPLVEDDALLADTKAAMAETGVGVFDMEIVRIGADFDIGSMAPFLDICGDLGVKAILVAGDDPDRSRLTASFAEFCMAALPFGIRPSLEFMPWTSVPDARTALGIVEGAGQDNGAVLVDALHVARSHTSLQDLAAIPAGRLCYAQACDAPAEVPTTDRELIFTARRGRLLPGQGGIDLVGIFRQLPSDLPISVEIPNASRIKAIGVREWARLARETTLQMLSQRAKSRGTA